MSLFSFLLLLFPEYVYMSFSIEPSPTVQGVYGNPVYFNCTLPVTWKYIHFKIKHEVGYKFALFSGGDCKVSRSKADQYTVSCHGNTFTLGILRPEDNKTWECTYKDGNSTEEQFGGTTIDLQPDIPTVSLGNMTYVYTEGSDVIIPCTFSGAPISNVTWQRENEVIMWTQNSNGPLTLSIKNVSRTAAGNYTCSATVNFKGVYTASESFILVVEYPPTLVPGGKMVEVNEGSTLVNFSCTIQSHGVPSNFIAMYWQHWVGNRTVRNLTSDIGISRLDPASSTFLLSLPSISLFDAGSYVCKVGNGVNDLEGNVEKAASIDLIVKSIPKLIQMKTYYYGEIGKAFHITFQYVGNPAITVQIKPKDGQISPSFNVSLKSALLPINVYNKSVYVNGYTADMDFGTIKDWFNTTYEMIAENALGTSNYTFFVEGQDFPSKPYHIYFKEYETSAQLEWEAEVPDLDKHYTVHVKNSVGEDKLFKYPGTNSEIYSYYLTNLSSKSNIIQICTVNGVGKNCSSTFKIKMTQDSPKALAVSSNRKSKSGFNVGVILSIIVVVVIGIFVLVLVLRYRHKRSLKKYRRQASLLGRDDHPVQRISCAPVSSGYSESESRSFNTYLTPQCMTSLLPESPSCATTSSEGGEYARVDDIDIQKLKEQRNQGENPTYSEYTEITQPKNVRYVKKNCK